MKSFVGTILTGITVIVLTYIFLQRSSQTGQILQGATQSYSQVAKTFQGN